MRGAVGESRHVFIEAGFNFAAGADVRVLEVGFGTGLNAWLTLAEAEKSGRRVEYSAIELYPVDVATASKLGYTRDERFALMHRAPWGVRNEISPLFSLEKIEADLTSMELVGSGVDVVYFDAFAPDTQPEMWSLAIFEKLYEVMSEGGVLVTYSSKGEVKRALRAAGFTVERLEGALGKRHMLRAIKK
jgi:tRNA U34 5-methylaminomethyl-2-thiouridine-forming methyltransferase MnmC